MERKESMRNRKQKLNVPRKYRGSGEKKETDHAEMFREKGNGVNGSDTKN